MDRLLAALGAAEGETRFVGGCVRDTLLGLEVSDVDLATRLAPEEVIARLEAARIKAVPTGIAHGTVTAVIGGAPVEVTTLRRDVSTDGRRATIAYHRRLARGRGAARLHHQRAFAPTRRAARSSTISAASPISRRAGSASSATRCSASPRIICGSCASSASTPASARASPIAAGLDACAARANDLMALSRERIADELLKLLALPDPAPTVAADDRARHPPAGAARDRPARPAGRAGRRPSGRPASRPEPIRRLAALLPADAEVAAAVAARLRLSKRAAEAAGRAAPSRTSMPPEPLAYRIGADEAVDRLAAARNDRAADLKALETWQRPRLPVGGGDLIAHGAGGGPGGRGDAAGDRAGMGGGGLSGRCGSGPRDGAGARSIRRCVRASKRARRRRAAARRIEIALAVGAAELGQHLGQLVGLDALGGRLHAERARERQDGADDRGRIAVGEHLADEALVDLEHVDRQPLQQASEV